MVGNCEKQIDCNYPREWTAQSGGALKRQIKKQLLHTPTYECYTCDRSDLLIGKHCIETMSTTTQDKYNLGVKGNQLLMMVVIVNNYHMSELLRLVEGSHRNKQSVECVLKTLAEIFSIDSLAFPFRFLSMAAK